MNSRPAEHAAAADGRYAPAADRRVVLTLRSGRQSVYRIRTEAEPRDHSGRMPTVPGTDGTMPHCTTLRAA